MGKKLNTFFRWLITLAVVGAGIFLIWKLIISRDQSVYVKPLSAVRVEKPYRGTLEQSLELTGYVEAEAMIPVVPFVSGTIKEYLVNAGDYVEKDQLMAVIDPEPYRLQAEQAQAVYLAALATFERVSNLYKSGAATKQNYDEAKAQVDAYKAQLDLANVQLGYSNVTAPVSGTVLISEGAEGSVGTSSSYLFVIADLNALEINLNVPEMYFDIVNDNLSDIRAFVTREGAGAAAVVKSVAPYVSPESKTFKVTLSLTGDVSRFRPGMFVNVKLVYKTYEDVLLLDWGTVNTDGSIYLYDPENGTAVYAAVDTSVSNKEVFAVGEEYENTLFITDGQGRVLDGQKVNIIR